MGSGENKQSIDDYLKDSKLDYILLSPIPHLEYLKMVNHCDVGLVVLNKK